MARFFSKVKQLRKRSQLRISSKRRGLEQIKPRPRLKDPFGNILLLKGALTGFIGLATYRRFNIINKTKIIGDEHLKDLPRTNVLFVSNHQTYFADVIALYHIFASLKWKQKNINFPIYLLSPRVKSYYIAAEETMKSGFLPKLFAYAGAVTVKRSWRQAGEDIKGNSDFRAPSKIKKALDFGWVITFPQGTTTANAPVRKGAASMIKKMNPLVVPVKLNGFSEAFDKKGLRIKKKGIQLSVEFQAPIQFAEDASAEEIHSFLESHLVSVE